MKIYEILGFGRGEGNRFQARLGDMPLGPRHHDKLDAVRDLVRHGGRRAYVIDRSGAQPRADWHLFDTL